MRLDLLDRYVLLSLGDFDFLSFLAGLSFITLVYKNCIFCSVLCFVSILDYNIDLDLTGLSWSLSGLAAREALRRVLVGDIRDSGNSNLRS